MIDFTIPIGGMNQAETELNQTAVKLANRGFSSASDSVDLSSEMVSLMQSRNDFEANTKVVKTEDQMTKSLLDMVG